MGHNGKKKTLRKRETKQRVQMEVTVSVVSSVTIYQGARKEGVRRASKTQNLIVQTRRRHRNTWEDV